MLQIVYAMQILSFLVNLFVTNEAPLILRDRRWGQWTDAKPPLTNDWKRRQQNQPIYLHSKHRRCSGIGKGWNTPATPVHGEDEGSNEISSFHHSRYAAPRPIAKVELGLNGCCMAATKRLNIPVHDICLIVEL